MNRIKLIVISVLLFARILSPFFSLAQSGENGIRFESGLTWDQVKAKAKAENKYVFIDCYATWCGPCKYMDKVIFPQKETGDYFNAHFINVRVQMDRTDQDLPDVRTWYADAAALKEQYQMSGYPTYLFFTPNGEFACRSGGSTQTVKEFIEKAEQAIDPGRYQNMLSQVETRKDDSIFLLDLLTNALAVSDKAHAMTVGMAYLGSLKEPLTNGNITLLTRLIRVDPAATTDGFQFMLKNAHRIDRVMQDTTYVERIVTPAIIDMEVIPLLAKDENSIIAWREVSAALKKKYPMLGRRFIEFATDNFKDLVRFEIKNSSKSAGELPDWNKIYKEIKKRFPGYDWEETVLEEEIDYCADKKKWRECEEASFKLLKKYGSQLNPDRLNDIAWNVLFLHTDKKEILVEALKWVKRSIERGSQQTDSYYFRDMDTYANLLYKAGQQKEAISWENKAIELAISINDNPNEIQQFKAALEKMKHNIPTWPDSPGTSSTNK